MSTRLTTCFAIGLFLGVVLLATAPAAQADDCYEAWSRCTGWSSGATGYLWKTCAGRCQLCKGRANGECKKVNGKCGARQQCQCSGGSVPKSTNWIDIQTCRMG